VVSSDRRSRVSTESDLSNHDFWNNWYFWSKAPLVAQFEEEMVVFAHLGFHAKKGDPSNLKLCRRGQWNQRMLVETVLSMMTQVWHLKKVAHRAWDYFRARLAFTMAAFNLVVQRALLHE
jgi:hypothetical protein